MSRGLTQRALAQAIGIACQQLHKYEIGENRLSAARLYQLSIVLDVSVMWFFEGVPLSSSAGPASASENGSDDMRRLLKARFNIEDGNARQILLELAEHLSRQGAG